eukprot:1632204-Rhodomonas_salina.1
MSEEGERVWGGGWRRGEREEGGGGGALSLFALSSILLHLSPSSPHPPPSSPGRSVLLPPSSFPSVLHPLLPPRTPPKRSMVRSEHQAYAAVSELNPWRRTSGCCFRVPVSRCTVDAVLHKRGVTRGKDVQRPLLLIPNQYHLAASHLGYASTLNQRGYYSLRYSFCIRGHNPRCTELPCHTPPIAREGLLAWRSSVARKSGLPSGASLRLWYHSPRLRIAHSDPNITAPLPAVLATGQSSSLS